MANFALENHAPVPSAPFSFGSQTLHLYMKKFLLSAAFLCGAFALQAAPSAPTAAWGEIFGSNTTAGDQAQAVVVASDGNVYWHMMSGSYSTDRTAYFGGVALFQGSDYDPSGTSQNNNLCVLKTDQQGNVLWNLHSESNDFANNQGKVEATSDGGVVFTAKLRCTDFGTACAWEDTKLVDGQGKTHSFAWTHSATDTRRYYRALVGRLSASGELLWVRFLECDRSPVPSASGNYSDFTADAISIPALTVDASDNVYVGGNYRQTLHIQGSDVTLTPHNIANWSGDPQSRAGDLYLIKFDGEGNYLSHVVTTGTLNSESLDKLSFQSGKIYGEALLFGENASMTLCGKSFATVGDFSPVVFCLDTDLNAEWINSLKGESVKGKYGFQNTGLTVCGNNLWFTGMFDGTISEQGNSDNKFASTEATPSIREGFLLKLDANTGEWIKGVSSRASFPTSLGTGYNGITGYFKALVNPEYPDRVYCYGYVMNANIGVFLRAYDGVTLEADPTKEWKLVTGGGQPTCQAIAYDSKNGRIFVTARGRNAAFKLLGGLSVDVPSTWSVLTAAYDMPEEFLSTDSRVVTGAAADTLTVYGQNGEIAIDNASEAVVPVSIYDLSGRQVASVSAQPGHNTVTVAPGLYIAAGKKVMVK